MGVVNDEGRGDTYKWVWLYKGGALRHWRGVAISGWSPRRRKHCRCEVLKCINTETIQANGL